MRSPVRSLTGALIVFGSIAACSVDQTGLGGSASGGGGGAAGSASPDASGTAGSGTGGGAGGRGGTIGVAGASGIGGGAAGTGIAGIGGVAGTSGPGGGLGGGPGGTGPGDAGAAGTAAVGGSGGTSDVAGQGGGGAAGTGTAGMGGAGGTTDPTCGPSSCPNGCCREGQCVTNRNDQVCGTAGAACHACASCFRCGTQSSCEPTPSARWTVICQSAVIAAMKPNGMTWDAPPPATSGIAPDTFCELTIDDDDTGATSAVSDSLTPMWNQSVNPTGGENVTASLLMSAQNRWRIAIIDRDIQPPGSTEPVCQVMPRLTADDLQRGMISLMAGSCTQVNLGLACDEN
jgi:hypothetical protein